MYICKQGGTRPRFDAVDLGPLQLVGGTPDLPQVQVYLGVACLGRFTVQGWSNAGHGMVNPSQSAGVLMATVGEAQVYLFVTGHNHKLSIYVSPVPDTTA